MTPRPSEKVPTTAVLVMANHQLLRPGTGDAPALAVFALDPRATPDYLADIARRMFALKNTHPADPDLRAVAQIVTDERSVPHRRRALPATFTRGPVVYAADLHITRRYLKAGFLDAMAVPCLAIPGYTGTLELLPHWAAGGPVRAAVAAASAAPVLTVTAAAAEAFHAARKAAGEPEDTIMRVGVHTDDTGMYALDLDHGVTDADWVASYYWVTVAVDTAHVPFLRGTAVDYDPVKGGFTFDRDESLANPPAAEELPLADEEAEDLPMADEV